MNLKKENLREREFFVRSRLSRDDAEAWQRHAAQGIPKTYADIAQKAHSPALELIDQHTKSIMEGCKERARAAGLSFADETLEYIVTNRDLLELSPKLMIPTLYDSWVHDVDVL